MRLERALSIADLHRTARRRLPRPVLEIIDGGVADEVSLRENRAAFERVSLRPRALKELAGVELSTTVLGTAMSMPVLLGPCSFARMCHPGAEAAVAAAAAEAGITYVVPGAASAADPEAVAATATGPLWYQLYLGPDRTADAERVRRVHDAGYGALCVTVDTPGRPFRERDLRNRLAIPVRATPRLVAAGLVKPRWAAGFLAGSPGWGLGPRATRGDYASFAAMMGDLRPVRAADLAALRAAWDGPLVVKGVIRPEDIDPLVDLGVDAVVVSNHGGRNLDGTLTPLDVLPDIAASADGRIPVLLDSGVRRGTDVVKALCLGASAVLVGRAYLYGLAAGGQPGVRRSIEILRNELRVAMTFLGAPTVGELDEAWVRRSA